MALTLIASGTQSVVSGVSDATSFAYSTTNAGLYVAKVDVGSWARTNALEISVWDQNFQAGSGNALVYHNTGPKSDLILYTPPFPATDYYGLQLYSNQTASAPWKVYSLGSPTVAATGNLTMTGALQTIATVTGPHVYILKLDLTNMANGDEIMVDITDKVLSSSAIRTAWRSYYINAQIFDVKHSPPILVDTSTSFQIQQTAGTLRSIGYRVLQLT